MTFLSCIINPLIARATNKEIFFSTFQEKVSSRFSYYLANFIWTAMSVNDPINFLEQTTLKWLSSGHLEFE